jgi:hypothetical protein
MDVKQGSALGFIETEGLAAAIAAADAALKSANVRLIGREISKGQGYVTVKVSGDVAAVQAAISAARAAAEGVSQAVSTDVIPRPASGLGSVMVWNGETAGPLCGKQAEPSLPVPVGDFPLAVSAPEPVTTVSGAEQGTDAKPDPEPAAETKPEPEPAADVKPDETPEATPMKESKQEDAGGGTTTGEEPAGEKQGSTDGKKTPPHNKPPRSKRKR